jgi:hypothetical protein
MRDSLISMRSDGDEHRTSDSGRVTHLLIVRLWREDAALDTQWRGFLDHSATGNRQFFAGLDQLTARIAHLIGDDR